MIASGWANNCGNELFTVGWVTCAVAPEDPYAVNHTYSGVSFSQALREDEEVIMMCRMLLEIM
jgi:hypothetical protein